MNFNSIEFLVFIPLVFLCLKFTPLRYRWFILLLGSWYFYLTLKHLSLFLILILVIAITYLSGLLLGRCRHAGLRRAIFWSGVAANLLVLIGAKYLPFLASNFNVLFHRLSLSVALPRFTTVITIGVSYFVFQAISYLIDSYFEIIEPEQHPGIFALYLSFFPKLLQGPIERGNDLLPQLRIPFRFDQNNLREGLLIFGWGLFKKAVLADRLALYVNTAYGDLPGHAGLPLLLATYIYALQIYYDFSGYTDMAIGSARIFNIRLTQNFNSPYLATSVADFWRRWHISFSRWILDYIFKPLQFWWRDKRQFGTAAALIVTFLISGLWHGASWCFVVGGGLHGIYLASSVFYKPLQKKIYQWLGFGKSPWLRLWQMTVTFHLVCLAWIFFRAASLADAWYVLTHLVYGRNNVADFLLAHGAPDLLIVLSSLMLIWTVQWIKDKTSIGLNFFAAPAWLRWGAYCVLGTVLLLFNADSNVGFIYFQF